jgi:hypothetical protein
MAFHLKAILFYFMRNPAACRDSGDLFPKVLRISASRSSRRNEERSGNAGVGQLTGTTDEMALALTFVAARCTGEIRKFPARWQIPGLASRPVFGQDSLRADCRHCGAGRIGAAYGCMVVEGHKMHLEIL